MNNLEKIKRIKIHRNLQKIKSEIFDLIESEYLYSNGTIQNRIKNICELNQYDVQIDYDHENSKLNINLKPPTIITSLNLDIKIESVIYKNGN